MKIAIVGGGIGGMSLALSLHAAGFDDLDLYESASAIRELGVGINILPHAVRELTELDLQDELSQVGVATADLTYFSRLGQVIWEEPLGVAAGYHWPQISIHRGELLGVLHRAVVKRLGAHRIHTSHNLVRFSVEPGGVWAQFVDREEQSVGARVKADLLIGCDGIHSAVRRTQYPDEGPPRWNGVTMWRGVSEGKPFLSGSSMVNIGSSRQRAVVYPISNSMDGGGRSLINWVATRKVSTSEMPPQDWTYLAQREEVLDAFKEFSFDFLDLVQLVRNAEVIYQYPMVDRDPLPTWNFDRATLLGDAAHPMHPVGGNGASQAIIDARVLARELALQPTIEAALAAYDDQRRPATAAVVQSNRRAGPHRCQDLVEERAPNGFKAVRDVISQAELEEIAEEYKRIGGFEVERLNSRESLSVSAPVRGRRGSRPSIAVEVHATPPPMGSRGRSMTELDHLVLATNDLESTVDWVSRALGVRPGPGGQHLGVGTRNFLLGLGSGQYLEIIGPDSDQPEPPRPRPFGIDVIDRPKLTAWVARSAALEDAVASAAQHGYYLGPIEEMSRTTPDGQVLRWRLTWRRPSAVDLIPLLIDWGTTTHPSATAPAGASLVAFKAVHPQPDHVRNVLTGLGLDLEVSIGAEPCLIAQLSGPAGPLQLS